MYVETSDMIDLRSKWNEAGVTSSPLFFGITPAQKNYSGVYLVLCDSHPNIIETVTAPSHPTMYIQPNTPLKNTTSKLSKILVIGVCSLFAFGRWVGLGWATSFPAHVRSELKGWIFPSSFLSLNS